MRGQDWIALGEYVGYFGQDGVTHLAEVLRIDNGVFTLRLETGAIVQHVHHRHITPHLTPREEVLVAARRQHGITRARVA